MLKTTDIFVFGFLCSLQGRLDGFPTPRPMPNLDGGVRSTAQPSASYSSLWTFPAMRLHSSYRRDWISSTSVLLLPTTNRNRISWSSYSDNGKDRIWSSGPLSPPLSDPQAVILPSEQRPYPSFDNKDMSRVLYDSSQILLADSSMSISPLSDNKLKTSSMSSCAMRLSNFRLSKDEESPMILFDQNGKMYTNYYPPVRRRAPQQKTYEADGGHRY
ncbi:uncharacterized protein LOC111038473 [Myzus persicae]|uniref:uncharacterized protein LOC111038473 n=1 Tax=Myzus persicae TaxID=13164 RepID=UPI000B939A35|nr:uncharacterized protein LOC111038473 [Myzus persicae]